MPHYKVTANHLSPPEVWFDSDSDNIGTTTPFAGPLSYCIFNASPIPHEDYLMEVTNHPSGDWQIRAWQGNVGGVQGFWTDIDGTGAVQAENPTEIYNRMIGRDNAA